jgi:aspartyl aminopeptidase
MISQEQRCGSTVGPKMSASLAIRTADIGAPQLSMHSCREMMGTFAVDQLRLFCSTYFENYSKVNDNITVDL